MSSRIVGAPRSAGGAPPRSLGLAFAAVLPDLAKGLRAAIATVVPFYLARALGRPELAWVALGGWLGSLADPGGTRRVRATTMAAFLVASALAIAAGVTAAGSPVASVAVIAAVVFVASMARALGGNAQSVGTTVAIAVVIAAQAVGADPLATAGYFAIGALWALALSSVVWPVWPHMPLRAPTARVYAALAEYVEALAAIAPLPASVPARAPAAWSQIARGRQRPVRAALEVAHAAMVELRARRSGETTVGANTRTILGEAEAEFFKLIGYADELEARPATTADLAALAELARSYREISAQLLTRVAGRWRPTDDLALTSRLARELVAASRIVVEVSRNLDVLPTAPTSAVATPHAVHPTATAARDAFTASSPILHHAIRVTLTAIAAVVIGRVASPRHAQWVSITALAVLQPYLGPTLARLGERIVGTIAGSVIAVGLIALVDDPLATAAVMFPLAVIAVVTRPRSYRLFVVFLTPVFLLVADRGNPSFDTALIRVLDVGIGGAIAAVAAVIRPSWERARLPDALVAALAAVGAYVDAAFAGAPRSALASERRRVGIALETAEASLERMLAEPQRLQHGTADALLLVTYARRIAGALTSLSEALAAHPDAPRPELAPAVRAWIHDQLTAARRFVGAGDTAVPAPAPDADPQLARLVHHAELVGRIAAPRVVAAA